MKSIATELTHVKLGTMLEKTGCGFRECKSRGEELGPQLGATRWQEVDGGWPTAIKKYGTFFAAEALEPAWALKPGSLGRALWAVGQKSEPSIHTRAGL